MGGVFLEGERARAVQRPALTLFFRDGKSVFPARQNTSHKHNGPAPHPTGSRPGGPGPDGRRRGRRQEGGEAEGRERVDRCVFFFFSVRVASARRAELPAAVGPGAWASGGLASRPALLSVVRRRAKASEWWWMAASARVGPGGAPALARPPDRRGPWCPRRPRPFPPPPGAIQTEAAPGAGGRRRERVAPSAPPTPITLRCRLHAHRACGRVWCVEPRPVGADEKEAARSELKRRSLFLLLSALLCLLRIVPSVASSGAACTLCMCWHCRARGNWGRAAPCSALRRGGGARAHAHSVSKNTLPLSLFARPPLTHTPSPPNTHSRRRRRAGEDHHQERLCGRRILRGECWWW